MEKSQEILDKEWASLKELVQHFNSKANHIADRQANFKLTIDILRRNRDYLTAACCEVVVDQTDITPDIFAQKQNHEYLHIVKYLVDQYHPEVKSVKTKLRIELFNQYYSKLLKTLYKRETTMGKKKSIELDIDKKLF